MLKFTASLEENLITIQNELIHKTYKVGRYKEFYIYEPKKRLIMALPFKDRVIQWAIYKVLNPIFEKSYIYHSYACREGKGTHAAAKQLQYQLKIISKKPGKWYYLKLDMAKYFYRVDHEILLNIIERKIKDNDVLDLLSLIINSETTKFGLPLVYDDLTKVKRLDKIGIPIGNLISQMCANIYLNELDYYVKQELGIKYHIRYMDDFIILHNNKKYIHEIKDKIENFIGDSLNLNLNRKTTIGRTKAGITFVGYRIWNTHTRIKKQTALRIKRSLNHLTKQYVKGKVKKDRIVAAYASYMGMLKHCNSYNLRKSIKRKLIKILNCG